MFASHPARLPKRPVHQLQAHLLDATVCAVCTVGIVSHCVCIESLLTEAVGVAVGSNQCTLAGESGTAGQELYSRDSTQHISARTTYPSVELLFQKVTRKGYSVLCSPSGTQTVLANTGLPILYVCSHHISLSKTSLLVSMVSFPARLLSLRPSYPDSISSAAHAFWRTGPMCSTWTKESCILRGPVRQSCKHVATRKFGDRDTSNAGLRYETKVLPEFFAGYCNRFLVQSCLAMGNSAPE